MKGHPLFVALYGPELNARADALGFLVAVRVISRAEAAAFELTERTRRHEWFKVLVVSDKGIWLLVEVKPQTALAWLLLFAGASVKSPRGVRLLVDGPSCAAGDVYPGALLLDDLAAAAYSQAGERAAGWPRVTPPQVEQFSAAIALCLDGWAAVTGNAPGFAVEAIAPTPIDLAELLP